MLHFSAENFFWCAATLREIRCDCYIASATCLGGEAGFQPSRDLDTKARDKAAGSLPLVEQQFRQLGLTIAADTVADLVNALANVQQRHSFEWLIGRIDAIESVSRKELKTKTFLYVSPEKAKFWPTKVEPYLFGATVANHFPSAGSDIFSAGTCLATSHPTAAVFHLMRVLEIGLAALGKVFQVSIANTNWANAIDQIESKVREMHKDPTWKALADCKEQQTFYAQAASHLGISKDAWRNHTMHGRNRYSDDEAERIFNAVRAFMQKLAERISE